MSTKILIITDDAHDATMLKHSLENTHSDEFDVEWCRQLSAGIVRLKAGNIDAVVLDLLLPDCCGITTFDQLFLAIPHTPIVILSAPDEEALAIEAVQRGAQGYLSKGHFVSSLVPQTLRNIIHRKNIEEAMYTEKARAEIALNSISDAVICTDLLGKIDYLNIAAEKITGWTRLEAKGQAIDKIFNIVNGETHLPPQRNPVYLVLEKNTAMTLNAGTVLIQRNGNEVAIEDSASPIHNWDGSLTGAVIVFHDVSAALSMTLKMAHLAQHDYLTNLPNRVLLNDRIAQAIMHAQRDQSQLALLFLDIDHFKKINDTLGHATGDLLLQSITQRLKACVRSSDTVCRQGGDEFVILLAGAKSATHAAATAQKILKSLRLPHVIAPHTLYISTSIGISIYPADGIEDSTLIKHADAAMYVAKENGRNQFQFFQHEVAELS